VEEEARVDKRCKTTAAVIFTLAEPYLEEPQDVGHHDGDRAARGADDADHPLRFGDDGGPAVDAAHLGAVLLDEGLHEGQRLLQGVRVPRARVQDAGAQGDVGEQVGVVVDAVQGEEHGLQAMDALLLLQLPAGFALRAPAVHGEEPPERDVPVDADGVHVRVALALGLGGTPGRPPPAPGTQEEAEGETLHAKVTPAHRQSRAGANLVARNPAAVRERGGRGQAAWLPAGSRSRHRQRLAAVMPVPGEQRAAGLQEGDGVGMATPGRRGGSGDVSPSKASGPSSGALGRGRRGGRGREKELSRRVKRTSAIPSSHQGARHKSALGVIAKKKKYLGFT